MLFRKSVFHNLFMPSDHAQPGLSPYIVRRKDGVKFAPPPSGKNNTKQDRKVEAYDLMDLVVYEENKVLIQFLGESDTINRHLPSNQSSTVEDILTSLLAQCASQLIEIHFYASPEEWRNEHCLYSPLVCCRRTLVLC